MDAQLAAHGNACRLRNPRRTGVVDIESIDALVETAPVARLLQCDMCFGQRPALVF